MGSDSRGTKALHGHMRGAFVAVLSLLIAALVVPTAVLLFAWHATEQESVAEGEPATFVPNTLARAVSVTATASLAWRDAATVPAPLWPGITTAVLVQQGENLEDAMPVARIDGVEVRYYVLESPLYQRVCPGESVLLPEVRHILQSAGLPVANSKASAQTDIDSIRKYAKTIGVPNASSATCFDPAWVVSTETPLGTIADIGLAVGAPPPRQGEAVLTGEPTLASLSVLGNTGVPEIDERLNAEGASVFANSEISIGGIPTGVSLVALDDPNALSTLAARLNPEEDATTIAVTLALTDTQFVVPATSVIDATGAQPCMESASNGKLAAISVIASSVNGLIVDLGVADASSTFLATPERSECV